MRWVLGGLRQAVAADGVASGSGDGGQAGALRSAHSESGRVCVCVCV